MSAAGQRSKDCSFVASSTIHLGGSSGGKNVAYGSSRGSASPFFAATDRALVDWEESGDVGGGSGGGGGGGGGNGSGVSGRDDGDSTSVDRSNGTTLGQAHSSGGSSSSEFFCGSSDECSTGRWGEWTTVCKTRKTAETVDLPRAVDRASTPPLGLRYRVGARRREAGARAAFR